MDLGEIEWGDVDGIGLAQDRDRFRALFNEIMNLRFPLNAGFYRVASQLEASRAVAIFLRLI
jgi:hypothetical protein